MAESDMLLQLIEDLQRNASVAYGRRTLLEHIRKSSRARLGLLFLVQVEQQTLRLLEQSGRPPRHASHGHSTQGVQETEPGPYTQECSQTILDDQSAANMLIPLHGLFGTAIHAQGLLHIADAFADERSLEEERSWMWCGGPIVLSAIGHGQQQGVLVLCFGPKDEPGNLEERTFLLCIALLSGYLSLPEVESLDKPVAPPYETGQHVRKVEETQETRETQEVAIDQERRRIARDIHDGAAQNIAHVLHKLEFIQRVLEHRPQEALQELQRAHGILEESLKELRHGISSLLPLQLEEQGFEEALQSLIDAFAQLEPRVEVDYSTQHLDLLPPSLEVPIYRFLQEALNNVHKHAHASHVTVVIRALPGRFIVQVSDDGVGMLVGRDEHIRGAMHGLHLGLQGMHERIQQAGGALEVRSRLGEGTTLKVRFPLGSPARLLTKREREVLQLLVEGSTNRAIAEALSVSIETVKSHVHHIMQKMQVKDRTQAAVFATKQHWL